MLMKFDDASWHVESVPRGDDEYDYAMAHIVAYVSWALRRGWAGEIHTECPDDKELLDQAINGELSFSRYFERNCDCKFTDEDLVGEGLEFTKWYYESRWLDDIMALAGDCVYTCKAEDYPQKDIDISLDAAYAAWRSKGD